ncbi:MAG: hypothetical protein GX556_16585, partial [Fibrobacter sp.]|nr:hypothetical protein [Fibrobacter sp.]
MEAAEFRERLLDHLRLTAEPNRVYRTDKPWDIGPPGPDRGDPNLSFALPHAEALANALADGIPDHQGVIISFYDPTVSIPQNPALFDRYIAVSDGSGWTANHIYEWSGAIWLDTAPRPGMFRWIDEELDFFGFNGTEWYAVSSGSGQPQQHELTGELHTVSGTPGHVLRLVTANSAAFEALTAADVGADAAGSALAAITGHLNTWDHSGFLTVENAVLNTDPRIANWDTAYSWGNHAGLYAAASHNHSASNITSGTLSVTRGGTGAGTLTGYVKGNGTAAFTASTSIPWADLSGIPGAFTPSAHTHLWADISDKPNTDYYVQGSSSTRTTDAGSTDVNSYTQSGFYRAASTVPNLPTVNGYGIIHTNHTSNSAAFQLASRWNSNELFYRTKYNDSWEPWVEIYHSGNFDTNDYALVGHTHDALYAAASHNHSAGHITSGTLSVTRGGTGAGTLTGYVKGNGTAAFTASTSIPWADLSGVPGAFTPSAHTHLWADITDKPNTDYYVQGSSSTRTTDAGSTDVNSYTQSGFYRATTAAPHNPTVNGYGIIHTNHTSNSAAFQLASRWNSNELFYRTKYNDSWE